MNLSNWLTTSKTPFSPINPVEFESDFIFTKLRREMGEQIIFHIWLLKFAIIIIVTLVSEWGPNCIAVPPNNFHPIKIIELFNPCKAGYLRRPSSSCVSGELLDDDDDFKFYMLKKFWNHSYGWVLLMNP
jgi:hypothetical protein